MGLNSKRAGQIVKCAYLIIDGPGLLKAAQRLAEGVIAEIVSRAAAAVSHRNQPPRRISTVESRCAGRKSLRVVEVLDFIAGPNTRRQRRAIVSRSGERA